MQQHYKDLSVHRMGVYCSICIWCSAASEPKLWRLGDLLDLFLDGVMEPLTRGDRCATGGLPERAKPMSLATDGMGDMEGMGDMRRSAKDGKHCSE
jgi:hypothetical protein